MGKSLTNANRQQYRDEVGELIANYVVNVSDKLDARTERASKVVLIDSIAVAIAALRHPAAQNARKHAYRFPANRDRKSTRLNSSHGYISYAVFCLKKKKKK